MPNDTHETDPARGPDFVGSLARGLSVIRAFSADAPEMTLTEVARRTQMTRASARRFLMTLEQLGYICSDGKRFRLAPRILDLGFAYLSSTHIWQAAMPHMEAISEELDESCSVSVIDGCEIVYVARVPVRRLMSISLNLGARLPALPTSMGRALLAHLPEAKAHERVMSCAHRAYTRHTVTDRERLWEILAGVRAQGWALVDQELEEGLRSVAVPLRSRSGRVVAALNLSANASRTSIDEMQGRYLSALREAASRIAQTLPA